MITITTLKRNILSLLIFSPSFIFGQIIYTDVNPDSTVTSVYELDVNNDSIYEFRIKAVIEGGINIIRAEGITEEDSIAGFYGSFPNVVGYPFAYASDINISINGSWVDKGILGGNHSIIMEDAQWNTTQSRFMGLRFKIGTETHYGWVRLKMGATYSSFSVREYAYNATPDEAIISGVTSVNEINNSITDLMLFPNPADQQTQLNFFLKEESAIQLSIYDINGQLIFSESTGKKVSGNQVIKINTSQLNSAIYFCKIDTEKTSAIKKLSVIR